MQVIKKLISIAIVTVMAVTTISGPAVIRSVSKRGSDASSGKPELESTVPSGAVTSRDIDCYRLGNTLCNRRGETVIGYRLDAEQNITDLSGKEIVSSEYVEQFTCANEIRYNENDLRQTLQTATDSAEKEAVVPASVSLRLLVQPPDAVNRELILTSKNPSILYFPVSAPGADFDITSSAAQSSPTVTAEPDADGVLKVTCIAAGKGHAAVEVSNVLGEAIETMEFIFLAGDKKLGEQTAAGQSVNGQALSVSSSPDDPPGKAPADGHEHVYKTQTMNPTIRTKGYTLHVCTICGYTYRDNYTDLDLCQHQWRVVKTVQATADSAGYTLYECTVCGQQERRDPTGQETAGLPKACSHLICSAEVIPATCTKDGYTLHECLICRDYSYIDGETPALGHSWDEGAVTKEASCLESGTRTFTCRSCDATKTESIPASGHSWDDGLVTVTPAEGSKGMKAYTCKFCGTVRM